MVAPKLPERPKQMDEPLPPEERQPGTNDIQHHPDPQATPMPRGEQPYHSDNPYTTGNY